MCDCANACPDDVLSGFARKQFEAEGLADIAVRICQAEPLSVVDAQRLANAPLPLLAKLASLRPDYGPCRSPAIEPVVCLPVAQWLAQKRACDVIACAFDATCSAAAELASLVDRNERIQEFGDCVRTLHVALDGPKETARQIFGAVSDRFARAKEPSGVALSLAEPAFPATLICEAEAAGAVRQVAIEYLASPFHAEILAPLGRLGIKTAQVALSFGANHFGRVAVNLDTAESLRIPTLAELADALRYDTPTPV